MQKNRDNQKIKEQLNLKKSRPNKIVLMKYQNRYEIMIKS